MANAVGMRVAMQRSNGRRARRLARSFGAGVLAIAVVVLAAVPGNASPQDRSSAWSFVATPNEDGSNWLQAVDASAANNAWAVGYYVSPQGEWEMLAERWNGS